MNEIACVHVYAVFAHQCYLFDAFALSEVRRAKIAALQNPEVKILSAAADIALHHALLRHVPGYMPPPALSYDEPGRPTVPGAFISLSHTRGLAACAISNVPIGLDVEWERRMDEKIARRVLSKSEMAAFDFCADKNEFLLQKWVCKEAYLKYTGAGIAGGMHKYTEEKGVVTDENGAVCAYGAQVRIPGYRACVCTEQPFPAPIKVVFPLE